MPLAEMVDTVLDSGRKVAMNISETRLVGVGIVVLSVITAPFVPLARHVRGRAMAVA